MTQPAHASHPETAIELIQLTRRFGEMVALQELTLSVLRGSTFGLLGPNGAGKSTLIKMLTTLLKPSTGTAKIAGFDIIRHPSGAAENRIRLANVVGRWRSHGLREPADFGQDVWNAASGTRPAITQALEFMDLSHVRDKMVHQYSGGMIRRLEIAQSMLHRPAVFSWTNHRWA